MKHIAIALLAGAALTACTTPATTEVGGAETAKTASIFDKVEGDTRPAEDFEQYELRKARDVLAFTGVAPGMTVIDMEAGSGVYTELFARTVGDSGMVYMQNPPLFDNFAGDAIKARIAYDRLPNVKQMRTAFDTLSVGDGEADVITWFLGPHELWYNPDDAPAGILGNPDKAFDEIARALKPGGHFIALDHDAADGAPASTGGTTHRIDKVHVIKRAERAGLKLVGESDVLANPSDDYSKGVFDPEVRRKTDRFLLKFKKG